MRDRTAGRFGVLDAMARYLDDVRAAARAMEIELDTARLDPQRMTLEIAVQRAPEISVEWSPYLGWSFSAGGGRYYRVGREADAASMLPDPDEAAGWLAVLATGDRTGHAEQPMPLDPEDDTLVERLVTHGQGLDPHTPGVERP
ncbi:hypothetical protein EIL87_11950 [Saccharopolyspora rhizosphaerae]|uniref:Uncharacterized protein n=1 Tax=Saccharopolyspora rhizosphaerae TaxID=2492662 RepID=A0A3R8QPL6_9PSEU|nr:hypothetical protein [Saccharopolyspora rhizosphaerae]RRO16986.1 hypothetical protein EIL87_11950 [Saccharopolyspora rhizosphaerae]